MIKDPDIITDPDTIMEPVTTDEPDTITEPVTTDEPVVNTVLSAKSITRCLTSAAVIALFILFSIKFEASVYICCLVF